MKVTQQYSIWEDENNVYSQDIGLFTDDNQLPGHASNIVWSIRKKVEREMLKRFNLEQLGNLRQLVDELINEKIEDDKFDFNLDKTIIDLTINKNSDDLKFPTFKSYGLTKEQVFEVYENFINWQYKEAQGILIEAANDKAPYDSLPFETMQAYLKDVELLMNLKGNRSSVFYHRFMQ